MKRIFNEASKSGKELKKGLVAYKRNNVNGRKRKSHTILALNGSFLKHINDQHKIEHDFENNHYSFKDDWNVSAHRPIFFSCL